LLLLLLLLLLLCLCLLLFLGTSLLVSAQLDHLYIAALAKLYL
jgi:hypothetical protein